jgi:hypothetical protein
MASRHFSRRLDGRKRTRSDEARHKRDATQPRPRPIGHEYGDHGPPESCAKTRLVEVLDENGVASLPLLLITK